MVHGRSMEVVGELISIIISFNMFGPLKGSNLGQKINHTCF